MKKTIATLLAALTLTTCAIPASAHAHIGQGICGGIRSAFHHGSSCHSQLPSRPSQGQRCDTCHDSDQDGLCDQCGYACGTGSGSQGGQRCGACYDNDQDGFCDQCGYACGTGSGYGNGAGYQGGGHHGQGRGHGGHCR